MEAKAHAGQTPKSGLTKTHSVASEAVEELRFESVSLSGFRTNEDSWGFSSVGRAPALQAGGQRFDPANLHQYGSLAQSVRALA